MDGSVLGLVELLGIVAIVFFFAFRELWLLKKDRESRDGKEPAKDEPPDGKTGGD